MQYLQTRGQLLPSAVQGAFALDVKSNNIVKQQYYLLEKTEELTLYAIKQDKRIAAMEKKNKNQEQRPEPRCHKPSTPLPAQIPAKS